MNFWDRLEEVAERRSVLRHPFYIRWSEGTLTRPELALYAGQYRHVVVALADAAASAARSPEAGTAASGLATHASEEAGHVRLWDDFVAAVDGPINAEATEETRSCAATWAGDDSRPLLETLTTMYVIESAQPAISATKHDGLARHYEIPEAEYFSLHQELDVEHAAHTRELIARRLDGADEDSLVRAAEAALEANWSLLDGVDRLSAAGAAA